MPNKHTISLNNDNASGNYVFFQAQPAMTQAVGPIDPTNIFTNAWISQGCAKGGSIVITTTRDFYAWAGTVNKPAAVGTIVIGGKALPATLGTASVKGSTFNVTDIEDIVDIVPTDNSAPAATFISSTGSFTAADDVLVGMAKPDPDDDETFLPSAMINATGSMNITVTPKNDYWIVKADFGVGEIFDYTAVSKSAAKIAFEENQGKEKAIVTNKADGTWDIKYA